ncbi:MAG TPA: hypothetical protein VMV77_04810 [Bacteroidales bacterium]|nr:hypothetical protein [Bacteroidales bacterium]
MTKVSGTISQLRVSGSIGIGGSTTIDGSPSLLSAIVVLDTRIDLAWTNGSTNEDGISIERSTDGITYAEIDTVASGVAVYSDTTCVANTLYYYRVRAYLGTLFSEYSNVDSDTTLTSQYQTVYDAFTTKPAAAIATAQNTMIKTLVDYGIWSKMDVFYLFAQELNTDSEALKNWVNPGVNDASLVYAPLFTSLEGITTAYSGAKYINTNYNPATEGVKYSQDDAHVAIYLRQRLTVSREDVGIIGAHDVYIQCERSTPNAAFAINDNTLDSGANSNDIGLFCANRSASNSKLLYHNGVILLTKTTASTGLPNADMYVGKANGSAEVNDEQVSMMSAGGSLSEGEQLNYFSAIETYLASI